MRFWHEPTVAGVPSLTMPRRQNDIAAGYWPDKLYNTENVWVLKELHWCSRYIQTLHISKTCFAWSAFSTKVDENQAIYLLAMVWKYDHFEKKIWSHYNLACWKDTFEKKNTINIHHMIYMKIFFTTLRKFNRLKLFQQFIDKFLNM